MKRQKKALSKVIKKKSEVPAVQAKHRFKPAGALAGTFQN